MEHLLISNARHLRVVNDFGVKKILRNILALQQSIKTVTNEQKNAEFERAKRYYSLYFEPPAVRRLSEQWEVSKLICCLIQDMIDGIRKKQHFSFDEYKTMLDLQCGITGQGAQSNDRNYSMYVIDLHGLELESSGDS